MIAQHADAVPHHDTVELCADNDLFLGHSWCGTTPAPATTWATSTATAWAAATRTCVAGAPRGRGSTRTWSLRGWSRRACRCWGGFSDSACSIIACCCLNHACALDLLAHPCRAGGCGRRASGHSATEKIEIDIMKRVATLQGLDCVMHARYDHVRSWKLQMGSCA